MLWTASSTAEPIQHDLPPHIPPLQVMALAYLSTLCYRLVMDIVSILIALAVMGFVVWVITLIPMDARFRMVIQGVAVLALVIWLLRAVAPAFRI